MYPFSSSSVQSITIAYNFDLIHSEYLIQLFTIVAQLALLLELHISVGLQLLLLRISTTSPRNSYQQLSFVCKCYRHQGSSALPMVFYLIVGSYERKWFQLQRIFWYVSLNQLFISSQSKWFRKSRVILIGMFTSKKNPLCIESIPIKGVRA